MDEKFASENSLFRPETILFLEALGNNNNKSWFEAHRIDYESFVLEPMRTFVESLAPAILSIDPRLDVQPKVSKTISRIYRDTRFSKDKSPYRNHLWIGFKQDRKDWNEFAGFYFRFCPDSFGYGMGCHSMSRQSMDTIRERIDREERVFLTALKSMKKGGFELRGDSYKRPVDTSKSGVVFEWYQKKSVHVAHDEPMGNSFFSPGLVNQVAAAFLSIKPLYTFFAEALGD